MGGGALIWFGKYSRNQTKGTTEARMLLEGGFNPGPWRKESTKEGVFGVPAAIGVDQTLPHAIVPVPLYGSRKVRLGSHGKDCQPLQAQGFYLPVERNLRWSKRLLGLRATRN